MFAEVLAECIYYMNEKEASEFYRMCIENKHIRKRIEETEKYMTWEEVENLTKEWSKNIENDK